MLYESPRMPEALTIGPTADPRVFRAPDGRTPSPPEVAARDAARAQGAVLEPRLQGDARHAGVNRRS